MASECFLLFHFSHFVPFGMKFSWQLSSFARLTVEAKPHGTSKARDFAQARL